MLQEAFRAQRHQLAVKIQEGGYSQPQAQQLHHQLQQRQAVRPCPGHTTLALDHQAFTICSCPAASSSQTLSLYSSLCLPILLPIFLSLLRECNVFWQLSSLPKHLEMYLGDKAPTTSSNA